MTSMCEAVVGSRLAQLWWTEGTIAVASFTLWIALFRAVEVRCSARPTLTEQGKAYVSYYALVFMWSSIVPPTASEFGCPLGWGDASYLTLEVCAGIVAYDFVFFWLHLAMHEWPKLGLTLGHLKHHELDGREAGCNETAGRVTHHSAADGALQVIVNILVQRHTPWGAVKSKLARWLHNIIVTFMLTEAHTSAPWPRVARRLFAGVRDHHLHHRHRGAPYQQFFSCARSSLLH